MTLKEYLEEAVNAKKVKKDRTMQGKKEKKPVPRKAKFFFFKQAK